MAERRSLFEDLPVELFYLIFEYLAPHDLFFTFKNLNRRFTSILNQQPLCLPYNRYMNFDLYLKYISSIIPEHVSQIVYLNLSERVLHMQLIGSFPMCLSTNLFGRH
jgi:hypothetical protein